LVNILMENDVILKFKNVGKKIRDRVILEGVSFEVREGEIFGLLGGNGAGKSTLIRLLFGLVLPSAGYFYVGDYRCPPHNPEAKALMGGCLDNTSFYGNLTGIENITLFASLSSCYPRRGEIEYFASLLGFELSLLYKKVSGYSQGEKKKLSLLHSLFPLPRILVWDEPWVGLDPRGAKEVQELILALNAEERVTFFLSSPVSQEVEKIAQRAAILHQGKIKWNDYLTPNVSLEEIYWEIIERK